MRLLPLLSPVLVLAVLGVGCAPSIGDKCGLSTDCSLRGERQCDLAQPEGYCTVLNCGGNGCPESAACVLFNAAIPGCGYDDRAVARTARSFCMASCDSDSDCREGYVCKNPRGAPWTAVILDDDQGKRVCIAPQRESQPPAENRKAGVCGPSAPDVPPFPRIPSPEAGVDAGADAGADGGPDAAAEAGGDAAEAGADAGDAGIDDSGASDATGAGG